MGKAPTSLQSRDHTAGPAASTHPQTIPMSGNRDLNHPYFPQSGKQPDNTSAAGAYIYANNYNINAKIDKYIIYKYVIVYNMLKIIL